LIEVAQVGQNWTTYEDPILQISIQYPSDYEVTEAPGGVLFSSSPLEELPDPDSPEFSKERRKEELTRILGR
jgi:hypothetical protein